MEPEPNIYAWATSRQRLEDYDTEEGVVVFLILRLRGTGNAPTAEKYYAVPVEPSTTIAYFKATIRAYEHFNHLYFKGKKLDDGRTLADYNIQDVNILDLVL